MALSTREDGLELKALLGWPRWVLSHTLATARVPSLPEDSSISMGQIADDSLELFLKTQTDILRNHLHSGAELDLRFVIEHARTIQEVAYMLSDLRPLPQLTHR